MTRTGPLHLHAIAADGSRAAVVIEPGPIASGGDAAIHPVRDDAARVAKIYRDPLAEPRRRAKLDAMLAAPPEGRAAEHGGRRVVQLAWPEAILEYEPTAPLGYLMPRLDSAQAPVLEVLLSARSRRAAGLPESYRFRVAAARNLASAVASLHAAGHHVVDLKPANVHVTREGFVAILDCDGFSIRGPGGERFPAHQYTDGTIAPEALRSGARPEALGEDQDRFALAVVVFQLLNEGLHPFQGVPRPGADVPTTNGERVAAGLYPYGRTTNGRLGPSPLSLHESFDAATRDLFEAAFTGPPADRPSASTWRGHLSELLDDGLRPCDRDADHARFGDTPCGFCARQAPSVHTPPPASPPSRSVSAAGPPPAVGSGTTLHAAATPGAPTVPPSAANRRQSGRSPSPPGPLASGAARLTRGARQALRSWSMGRAHAPPPVAVSPSTATPAAPSKAREILKGLLYLVGILAGIVGFMAAIVFFATRGPITDSWDGDLEQAIDAYVPDLDRARRALDHGAQLERSGEVVVDAGPTPAYGPIDGHVGFPRGQEVRTSAWRSLAVPLDPDAAPYLFDAVEANSPEVTALLLSYRADADAADSWDRTPLMIAAMHMAPTIPLSDDEVRAVLRAGGGRELSARLTAAEADVGPAFRAAPSVGPALAAIDARLQDPDDEVRDEWDPNVRQLVANAAVVHLLLNAGADLDARDRWGRPALAYAAAYGHPVALRALLAAGADPDAADVAGVTPLMTLADQTVFVEDDSVAVGLATALLRAGADPDARDAAGRTARDYIGERWRTRRGKRAATEESRVERYPSTRPSGQTQLDSLLAAAGTSRTLPDRTVADIGDGGTAFARPLPSPSEPLQAELPWDQLQPVVVSCSGVPLGEVTASVTIGRTEAFVAGNVTDVVVSGWPGIPQRPPSDPEKYIAWQAAMRCATRVADRFGGLFDLRDEPERWVSGTVDLDVLAVPTEGPRPAAPRAPLE